MRTARAIGVSAVVAAALFAVQATSATTPPSLRLVKFQPLTVQGRSFAPGERVRVRVLAPDAAFRWATADRVGSFTARFDIPATRCDLIRVIAIGSGAGRVVLKRLPSPACSPG
jgi:hypothetical protein